MALATYTELKASVANYLNRSDLTSIIPDFISLTEGKLNRDLLLRSSVVRAETTTTSGTAYYNLPSDIIQLKISHMMALAQAVLYPTCLLNLVAGSTVG